MRFLLIISAVIAHFTVLQIHFGTATIEKTEMPDGTTKMSFTSPELDEEEFSSFFVPEMQKCDGCTIISYQLYKRFKKFNELHKYLKYDIPESEVLDIFEETCDRDIYEEYGIKTLNGQNRLSGPGLATKDKPGVIQGGGKWPSRLMDMCETFAGEVGEMEVYNGYKEKPSSQKHFTKFLCRGEGILGGCNKADKQRKKKEEL